MPCVGKGPCRHGDLRKPPWCCLDTAPLANAHVRARHAPRGSTGFGEDALQSLPGRVGRQDVDDCMDALDAAVAAGGNFTPPWLPWPMKRGAGKEDTRALGAVAALQASTQTRRPLASPPPQASPTPSARRSSAAPTAASSQARTLPRARRRYARAAPAPRAAPTPAPPTRTADP